LYIIEKLAPSNIVISAGSEYAVNLAGRFTTIPDAIYKANLACLATYINQSAIKIHTSAPKATNIPKAQPINKPTVKVEPIVLDVPTPTPKVIAKPVTEDEDITNVVEDDVEMTSVIPVVSKPKKVAKKQTKKTVKRKYVKKAKTNK
jgi:hypothetical protein